MSGGSYNYLCYKDSSEIGQRMEDLTKMRDRLNELGHGLEAQETSDIIGALADIDKLIANLSDVWHAVEWYDSGDWSKDQVDEVIKNHQPLNIV